MPLSEHQRLIQERVDGLVADLQRTVSQRHITRLRDDAHEQLRSAICYGVDQKELPDNSVKDTPYLTSCVLAGRQVTEHAFADQAGATGIDELYADLEEQGFASKTIDYKSAFEMTEELAPDGAPSAVGLELPDNYVMTLLVQQVNIKEQKMVHKQAPSEDKAAENRAARLKQNRERKAARAEAAGVDTPAARDESPGVEAGAEPVNGDSDVHSSPEAETDAEVGAETDVETDMESNTETDVEPAASEEGSS